MKRNKPDLLIVLSSLLVVGVLISSYGSQLLENLNVQAKPLNYSQNNEKTFK
jgi:hypothetical protein